MATKPVTIQFIYQEIERLDPKMTIGSDAFKAAVIMLSALKVGNDTATLSKFTGFPPKIISRFGTNLRKSRIWRAGQTHCNWFKEGGDGVIAFLMDVNVACGLMSRQPESNEK